MATVLRGEVVWVNLDPALGHEQRGRRPVLVLSHDTFNERSGTVIAVAVTSQEPAAGFPLTVPIPDGCLPKTSWVKVSQIRVLSTERLGGQLGRVPDDVLAQVVDGLNEIVG